MTTDPKHSTRQLARTARLAAVGDPSRRTVVSPDHPVPDRPRADDDETPTIELFHFVMSICSQKSRVALLEAGVEFASNELVIMPPAMENYTPEYVTLRMVSAQARERPLVSGYTGATDVEHEGFDPLVVPTLVDHGAGRVIADSREIALHADALSEGALVPEALRDDVMNELGVVDELPHAGLFYGADPDGDSRPGPIQQGMRGAHAKKIEAVERRLAELDADSPLRSAYEHKLLKERAGRAFIGEPENMRGLVAGTGQSIAAFETRLAERGTTWSVGEAFTLADIFWGVTLFRLLYLGYGRLWSDLPHVSAFAERAWARPSVRDGAIRWPGHPPGPAIDRYGS